MNRYIEEQILFTYGKKFEDMTEEEKAQITELTLFAENFRGEPTDIKISDLDVFPNIQKCLIKEFKLTDDDLRFLASIQSLRGVQFSNCDLGKTTSLNSGLELIILDGCTNVPKQFLKGNAALRIVRVVNQTYFDVASLAESLLLEKAYFQNTVIVNLMALRKLGSLKLVNLDGSKFNFLALPRLKEFVEVEYQKDSHPDLSR